jgi:hypothetical protein
MIEGDALFSGKRTLKESGIPSENMVFRGDGILLKWTLHGTTRNYMGTTRLLHGYYMVLHGTTWYYMGSTRVLYGYYMLHVSMVCPCSNWVVPDP